MTAYNDLLTGQFDQIGGLLTGQMEQLTSQGQIDELLKIKGTLWIFEKKAGRFERLLGFARSHFIVSRGSVSLPCTLPPFLNLGRIFFRKFVIG